VHIRVYDAGYDYPGLLNCLGMSTLGSETVQIYDLRRPQICQKGG
jgi:hypothetical protein